ncbi:helix-turn-helix domain-containing protein [Paenibacillus sp. strain BS8-2]
MIQLHAVFADNIQDASWVKPRSITLYDMLIFVTQGQVLYEVNGRRHRLSKGDWAYIPSGSLRNAAPIDGQPHHKYSVHFTGVGEWRDHFPILQEPRDSICHTSASQYNYANQRFGLLMQQWIGNLPYYKPYVIGLTMELLALACRDFEQMKVPTMKSAHVRELQQYMIEHYSEQIRLEQLAEQIGRTPNYVSTIFREVVGITPIDYMHQVRIANAKDMLTYGDMTIAVIADRLGYCDQSYFNRMFKRWAGQSPSSFYKEKSARNDGFGDNRTAASPS